MRKAPRTLGRLVLGLAVVSALGGLNPSHAAVGRLHVIGRGALPQDGQATVDVGNIARADGATPITSTTLKLTYALLPNGAPASITSPAFDPTPAGANAYKFTIPGPLLEGDYSVVVEQFVGANATALTYGTGALSVRIPATLTLTVLNETVDMPYFGTQRIFATLKDASGAPIMSHLVTLNVSGGIYPQTFQQVAKMTGGDGVAYFDLQEGATLVPGTYNANAKVLQSYTTATVGTQTIITSKTYLSADTTWNVLVAA